MSVVEGRDVTSRTKRWWHEGGGPREDIASTLSVSYGDVDVGFVPDLAESGDVSQDILVLAGALTWDVLGEHEALREMLSSRGMQVLSDDMWLSFDEPVVLTGLAGAHAAFIGGYLGRWAGPGGATGPPVPRRLAFLPGYVRPLGEQEMSFCVRKGLVDHLVLAVSLAEQYLRPTEPLAVELEEDAESDDEWLVLDAVMAGDSDDVLSCYQTCVSHWVAQVAWPEVNMIRFSYDVA